MPARDHDRGIFRLPYRAWWGNTWASLGSPVGTVNRFGWKRFLTTEVFPSDPLNRNREQFIPNYFLHGVGAGMHYRATAEWYQHHGFHRPRLWSLATMAAYHLLTETVETAGSGDLAVDAIADIYIFNPMGILLFSSDRVCRFFSGRLGLAEWSQQPVLNARTGNLENMGQFYVVRHPLSRDGAWSAMVHFGLHGMVGLSHNRPGGRSYSATAGLMVENLITADQEGEGRVLTAELTWSGGLFYDVNRSLMMSLMASGLSTNRARVNVYPGALKVGPFSPGMFAAWGRDLTFGLTCSYSPLGLGWGSHPQ